MSFIKTRRAGAGPNTVRLDLALLSHLFNTARTAWGMESLSNPVDLIKSRRPKLPQGRDRRLVDDEQARCPHTHPSSLVPDLTQKIRVVIQDLQELHQRQGRLGLAIFVT